LAVSQTKTVFVFSIDGVPETLLRQLIDAGELPNFAALAGQAPLRQMDSVYPTVSSVAWTSFVTGKQAGKHGIFGFVDRKRDSYEITIPLSTAVRSKAVWELLSDAGKRIFGMNVPVTYPPRSVNGILIADFLCPSIDKVALAPEVREYLKSISYQIDSDPMLARRSKDLMLPNIRETLDRGMEAMFHYLSAGPWDYFHSHVMTTDRLNHFLIAKFHEGGEKRYRDEFLEIYRMLDGYLGRLLGAIPEDCPLVVLSDHGFCPIIHEVHLSRYLVEAGWTALPSGGPRHPLDIDPARSKAYSLLPGRVYVNLRGREPAGIVPPEEYDRVREALSRDLLELRAPGGDPVIRSVMRREEVFWPDGTCGPDPGMPRERLLDPRGAFGAAPDLLAVPFDGYDLKIGLAAQQIFVSTELEGMHTFHDALIMARGIDLPEARFSIVDIMPAIFEALGVRCPEDVDGRSTRHG
jgi:predicted AlkP superfamily phosphohydrolase/phosphomutase